MGTPITASERAAYRRCRRQWDFGARSRQELEPVDAASSDDLDSVLREAMAVYYFPGMWDWDRAIVEPLVIKALHASFARRQPRVEHHSLAELEAVLRRYLAWAPSVDRFTPIRVSSDYEVDIPHPDDPARSVPGASRRPVRYRGRIDLLVADAADRYWIVRHRAVTRGWTDEALLTLDDRDLADAWAWQLEYLGLEVVGTVCNEIWIGDGRAPEPLAGVAASFAGDVRLAQHEASGGGRSLTGHRRARAKQAEPDDEREHVRQEAPGFRRTWIRRSARAIGMAGRDLGREAIDMRDPDVSVYPNPSAAHCPTCEFLRPCLALFEGQDVDDMLRTAFRRQPPPVIEEGRLGAATWGPRGGGSPFRKRERRDAD